jgi:molybdopterin-guanine dinucleotide biosynthesis protein A
MRANLRALILAGGRASRMGGLPKHELVISGSSILDRQLAVLQPRVSEVLISGPDIPGHRCVRDAAGTGPLAGIAAGLAACGTEWLLVVAGDMPYLSGDLLDRMIAARDRDAVGITHAGRPEPLLCVLRVAAARPAVDVLLAERRYKASGLLDRLDVVWIDEADARTLANVNAPEDLP